MLVSCGGATETCPGRSIHELNRLAGAANRLQKACREPCKYKNILALGTQQEWEQNMEVEEVTAKSLTAQKIPTGDFSEDQKIPRLPD